MKSKRMMLVFGTVAWAGMAGAAAEANGAAVNQPPVAVISNALQPKPGSLGMHYRFTAANSYDTDGSIVQYYWTSNCVYNPNVGTNGVEYDAVVYWGDTCLFDLYVTDDDGAIGNKQIVRSH